MNKDLRRKQKKAKRVTRATQRRANASSRTLPPRFDPDLPTTEADIETAIEELIPRLFEDVSGAVEYDERGRTIAMSPAMLQFMRLQIQLFRVVFRREPGPNDPVFWDRARESEGVFPLDPAESSGNLTRALAKAEVRPETAYAIAVTGIMPTPNNRHLIPQETLEQYEAAVADYIHQAATGVAPLAPDALVQALEVGDEFMGDLNVIPMGMAEVVETEINRMLGAVEDELGTHEAAVAALIRIGALVELTRRDEFKHLMTQDVIPDNVIVAAASAEIDRETGKFVIESFRERLEGLSTEI